LSAFASLYLDVFAFCLLPFFLSVFYVLCFFSGLEPRWLVSLSLSPCFCLCLWTRVSPSLCFGVPILASLSMSLSLSCLVSSYHLIFCLHLSCLPCVDRRHSPSKGMAEPHHQGGPCPMVLLASCCCLSCCCRAVVVFCCLRLFSMSCFAAVVLNGHDTNSLPTKVTNHDSRRWRNCRFRLSGREGRFMKHHVFSLS
jgi:hypothetical protein